MIQYQFTHYKCKYCRRVYEVTLDTSGFGLKFVSKDEAIALILAGRVHPNPGWCSVGCPALEPAACSPSEDTRSGGVRPT